MILTKSCVYGIQAAIYVASDEAHRAEAHRAEAHRAEAHRAEVHRTQVHSAEASTSARVTGVPRYVPINVIADDLHISFHFLTKVLQQFTHAGILSSYRGPNGGVALAKAASAITLFDLIVAIDGDHLFTQCLLGLPGCGVATPCPAHESWSEIRRNMIAIAKRTTLAVLAERKDELNARLPSFASAEPGSEHGTEWQVRPTDTVDGRSNERSDLASAFSALFGEAEHG